MELAIGIINLIVTVTVIFSMAALLFRGREELSVKMCMACQGMAAIWSSSQIFVAMSQDSKQLSVCYAYGNIGVCLIGLFWLWFAILYCGIKLTRILMAATLISPVFHYMAMLTNPLHHLYYAEFTRTKITHGLLFYSNFAIIYVYVLIGAVLLFKGVSIRNMREESLAQKNKAQVLIVLAVLIPTMFSMVNILFGDRLRYDTNSIGFGISMALVLLATFKYQFMDLKRELIITNEKLLLETERNRIAQQVHDTAGHTLTMIQSYMKLAEISVKNGKNDEAQEYLSEARALTGNGIKELRESINMLRQGENYELVTKGVMQLANQVKEMEVEVTVKGEDSEKYSHLSKTVYDTIRELITNALKYSGASKMEIVLRFKPHSLEATIADNGVGCEKISENNGIKGIRERIEKEKGKVRFMTAKGQGFLTRIEIPIK
jgi:signal transduction histidine kinase